VQSYRPSRSTPIAAAAVVETTLKVEAGGIVAPVTRETSGVPAAGLRSASRFAWLMRPDHTVGSYAG
jgi:hypothetical protein